MFILERKRTVQFNQSTVLLVQVIVSYVMPCNISKERCFLSQKYLLKSVDLDS